MIYIGQSPTHFDTPHGEWDPEAKRKCCKETIPNAIDNYKSEHFRYYLSKDFAFNHFLPFIDT